jgi:integrase
MAREQGTYRRQDSRFWWIAATLPDGTRICKSARTEDRKQAQAYLGKLIHDAYVSKYLGGKTPRSWKEAVVRFLEVKATLRDLKQYRGNCRRLDAYLGNKMLSEIDGDTVWQVIQGELKRGKKVATVNRHLALMRAILRMARDEWQWLDNVPKIRLLPGEVERDRWLTRKEADKLLAACAPHLAALVRYALATGCRAREIAGLEWNRVDLSRRTAWLNRTKNGTPRGVPLTEDAVRVLEEQIGKHSQFCFTYRGKPIKWELTNTGWHTALKRAGLTDLRFHDLRHTWASWHRQAGTSCDELKDLGGWKSRQMVDRYAKYSTEHLAVAAARIENGRGGTAVELSRFRHGRDGAA